MKIKDTEAASDRRSDTAQVDANLHTEPLTLDNVPEILGANPT